MTENLSFIIILEFVAPFAILSVVLLMALLNTNKKSKKGLSKLLQAIQGGEEDYKMKLKEFLKNSGTSEDQMDDLVQKFCKSRRAFFKRALSAISHSDSELLTGLGGQFGQFSDLYHQLSITSVSTTTDEETDVEESDDEATKELEATYKVVKRENKRLKAEVHVSVSALNSLFNEYASMFGETDKNKSDMSVEEVLDAMEKFTKGDFKPDNITGDIPPEDVAAAEAEKKEQKQSKDNQTKDEQTETTGETEDEANLNPSLEDIVVEDEEAIKPEAESTPVDEVKTKQERKDEEAEPNWDEAFEETGDTPDAAAMEQVKQAEQSKEETPTQNPTEQQEEESEPNWDEAFEETGDSPDEAAVEQVKQAEQEEQANSKQDSSSEDATETEKPPKPE